MPKWSAKDEKQLAKSEKKTEKIATKKRKQDHTEVSFRMTIFLLDAVHVLKEICNETLILVYV